VDSARGNGVPRGNGVMMVSRNLAVVGQVFGAREESEGFGLFVRSLVGLDRTSATEAFSGFLADTTYTASQIHTLSCSTSPETV